MKRQRLSPDLWIEAGLNTLIQHGASALGAEPLARRLGTTKGSFYWHFKNLPTFQIQVARAWKRAAAARLVTALEDGGPIASRLAQIAEPAPGEAEMRAWAHTNDAAHAELGEIDRLRLDATAALLRDFGISNAEIARALYAAGIGLAALPDSAQAVPAQADSAMQTLVDLILALR